MSKDIYAFLEEKLFQLNYHACLKKGTFKEELHITYDHDRTLCLELHIGYRNRLLFIKETEHLGFDQLTDRYYDCLRHVWDFSRHFLEESDLEGIIIRTHNFSPVYHGHSSENNIFYPLLEECGFHLIKKDKHFFETFLFQEHVFNLSVRDAYLLKEKSVLKNTLDFYHVVLRVLQRNQEKDPTFDFKFEDIGLHFYDFHCFIEGDCHFLQIERKQSVLQLMKQYRLSDPIYTTPEEAVAVESLEQAFQEWITGQIHKVRLEKLYNPSTHHTDLHIPKFSHHKDIQTEIIRLLKTKLSVYELECLFATAHRNKNISVKSYALNMQTTSSSSIKIASIGDYYLSYWDHYKDGSVYLYECSNEALLKCRELIDHHSRKRIDEFMEKTASQFERKQKKQV